MRQAILGALCAISSLSAQAPFLYKEVAAAVPQSDGTVQFFLTNGTTQRHHVETLQSMGAGEEPYCDPCYPQAWVSPFPSTYFTYSVTLNSQSNWGYCWPYLSDNPDAPDEYFCSPNPAFLCRGVVDLSFAPTTGYTVSVSSAPTSTGPWWVHSSGAWQETFTFPCNTQPQDIAWITITVSTVFGVVETQTFPLQAMCTDCVLHAPTETLTTGTLTNFLLLDGK